MLVISVLSCVLIERKKKILEFVKRCTLVNLTLFRVHIFIFQYKVAQILPFSSYCFVDMSEFLL